MSDEPDDGTGPDRDLMEGLLFDLGIFGAEQPATFAGGPRWRYGQMPALVERTVSVEPTTAPAACAAAPLSVTTELISFGDDPLHELTEECVHHVPGTRSLCSYSGVFRISERGAIPSLPSRHLPQYIFPDFCFGGVMYKLGVQGFRSA